MTEAPKDGGPAFPSVLYSHERAENWSTDGMSLRDWFAGQAVNGICAGLCGSPEENGDTRGGANHRLSFSAAAKDAYTIADAMLSERSKAGLPQ